MAKQNNRPLATSVDYRPEIFRHFFNPIIASIRATGATQACEIPHNNAKTIVEFLLGVMPRCAVQAPAVRQNERWRIAVAVNLDVQFGTVGPLDLLPLAAALVAWTIPARLTKKQQDGQKSAA